MRINNEHQFEDALRNLLDHVFEAIDAGAMTKETVIALLEEATKQVRDGEYDSV